MTDRELVDALRNTTSRSKRKLLDAAADRIEAAVDFETATNGEMICGIPLQVYRNTYVITSGGVLNPEVLHELRRMHEQQLAAEDRIKHYRRSLKRLLVQFMADYSKAVLDRRIKAIMGEEHFHPYETRYYYGRTGEENE